MLSGNRVVVVDLTNTVQDLITSSRMIVLASAMVAAPLSAVKSIWEWSCAVLPEDLYLAVTVIG